MAVIKKTKVIVWTWKAHKWIYKVSGGRFGQNFGDAKNLLLTTIGRKSGLLRDIAIYYFEVGDEIVIIGTNLGSEKHPAWYLNLVANPAVTVQIGTEIKLMIAREVLGEERARLWDAVGKISSEYDAYAATMKRQIPVIVFDEVE